MKRFFAILVCLFALPISGATMVRVSRVIDSRTLALDGGTTVTLRGVDVAPADEALAAEYLRSLVANNWVLVENGGDVYRSPDGLYVNGQLITHAYLARSRMTYLGESDPGPRARTTAPAPRASQPLHVAPRHHHVPHRGFVPRKRGV